MKPAQKLPDDYILIHEIDLSKNTLLLIKLNTIGLVLFLGSAWLFGWIAGLVRPEFVVQSLWHGKFEINLLTILGVLLAFGLTPVAHEAIHGLFFWLFTRSRPTFGLKVAYAYAAAPGWYIPRDQYLAVGLAPLVVLSLLGVLVLRVLSARLLLIWLFALTVNASGAVGDLYIVGWLLRQPGSILVNDRGDGMNIYGKRG